MRRFPTAGPVRPEDHYCIAPLDRLKLAEILDLIEAKLYFVMHAPRQTGKTSTLLALRDLLNGGRAGEYRCAYINVESAQTSREDVGRAMGAIAAEVEREALDAMGDAVMSEAASRLDTTRQPDAALGALLRMWSKAAGSPLVLLIDEIDAMVGDSLVSTLRQLRTGYPHRPAAFPQSVILCGVRDVRDYRIRASSEKEVITGGSAFNIKAESLRLGDFTPTEVKTLLGQHTAETGQEFAPGAVDAVWDQTRGQPWLVNALAYQACFQNPAGRDRTAVIGAEAIMDAREELILRRDTHIDQLADKLMEPRVRRVIEPMLSGGDPVHTARDSEYVRDLGLIARDLPLRIANPIYVEVIPRELTVAVQEGMGDLPPPKSYKRADGSLDMDMLLKSFQRFWRRNSEHCAELAQYREAGPHLLLQAFLHRVVNSDGRIEREYASGRGRVDLMIFWPAEVGGWTRFVVECKLVRDKDRQSYDGIVDEGLKQTAGYVDVNAAAEGHLVVFDAREGRKWEERIWRKEREWEGTKVVVWGA